MPSAANAKSEKPASSEATDNSPIRQIITILEHKIRNLEKRKSKLTSYRDLQKAGKELKSDQKVAVAKYDEVAQTLEFARELSKQVSAIAVSSERDAKKQAKKDAWVRYAAETNKIREVLLIMDCLMQMGTNDARVDFLNGTNGAVKLSEEDLKILDNLYSEVTPKHELNEEGQPGFYTYTTKAAEHLYAIIDGRPKEILGTTYAHIKEIISAVHECGYFDKSAEIVVPETNECAVTEEESLTPEVTPESEPETAPVYVPPMPIPAPPAPAVVPTPAYPLLPLSPITLQEVEHAYFSQQYPQPRPISEVIGSQNFFFLQESEIDSPAGTPQPPTILNQVSPPGPIPTQTFTNQHFVPLPGGRVPEPGTIPMPPQPHFPPHPEHAAFTALPMPSSLPTHPQQPHLSAIPVPPTPMQHMPQPVPQSIIIEPQPALTEETAITPIEEQNDDEWRENQSPEREEGVERKTQGQGDGQNRFRRYGRGGNGSRGSSNGYRGRGGYQNRQNNDGYHNRHGGEYQSNRGNNGYPNRHQNRSNNDGYYGNGDSGDNHQHNENGGRERFNDNNQNYQGGFKSRGRGGPRGPRGARPPRPQQYTRRTENVE